MVRGRLSLICLACSHFLLAPASAGVLSGANFLAMEPDAGPAGMGRAFVAMAEGSASQFWNPAGLSELEVPALTLSHLDSIADTRYNFFRVSSKLRNKPAGLALSVALSATDDLFLYDSFGQVEKKLVAQDLVVAFSGGCRLRKGLSMGASVKWFRSELAGFIASGPAFDAGLLLRGRPPLGSLGLSLANAGPGVRYIAVSDPLPFTLRAGYFQKVAGNSVHRFVASWEFDHQIPDASSVLILGASYAVKGIVALRGGYRFGPELGRVSAGAGFEASFFSMDYAFVPYSILGHTHRITVTLKKNSPKAPPEAPAVAASPVPLSTTTALHEPSPPEVALEPVPSLAVDPLLIIPGSVCRLAPQASLGPDEAWVLRIFDIRGGEVWRMQGRGPVTEVLHWEGLTASGHLVDTGVYKARFEIQGPTRPEARIRVKARESLVRTLPGELLFKAGLAELGPEGVGPLRVLAHEILDRYAGASVLVTGHTDDRPPKAGGNFASNQELSLARAEAVAALLRLEGLITTQVEARGLGSERPVEDNRLSQGRARNRRVEVEIRLAEAVSYLPDWLGGETVLEKEGSPYVLRGAPRVPAGSVLRVGPGVRIQSPAEGGSPGLAIAGRFLVEASAEEPVEIIWPAEAGPSLILEPGGALRGTGLRLRGGGLKVERASARLLSSSFEKGASVELLAQAGLDLSGCRLASGGVGLRLVAPDASAILRDCLVEGNVRAGLLVEQAGTLVVERTAFRNNTVPVILRAPIDLDLRTCTWDGDAGAGIQDGGTIPGAGRVILK